MTVRKVIFWAHLIAGIAAGIVILIMSATGVLLMYEKQMITWADRRYFIPAPTDGAPRLPVGVLASKIQEAAGANPTTITYYSGSAAVSGSAGGATWYVDSHTGEVLGAGATGLREFFRYVTQWHRYVALSGESRATGKVITGASNLIFLFIVASGAFIWWPRNSSPNSLRTAMWFRRGLSGKARNWNWHNVFGAWTAIPLFLVVLSATVISYPWAGDLVYTLTGTEAPAGGGRGGGRRAGGEAAAVDLSDADPLIRYAKEQVTGWRTVAMRIPTAAADPVTFTIDRSHGGQPQHRTTITLDRTTGEIAGIEKFADQNLGRRTRSWLRFVHTGEYYGFVGQTIAGIASFAGAMLVWTGFALSLHRFTSWVRRRGRTPEHAGASTNLRWDSKRVSR